MYKKEKIVKKITIISLSILLIVGGYLFRDITTKESVKIFDDEDAIYTIALNQFYINENTEDLLEKKDAANLKTLIQMLAFSKDIDAYGKLSRFTQNVKYDYTILFSEFNSLSGEYLHEIKNINLKETNPLKDYKDFMENYLVIGEDVVNVLDGLLKDEYLESNKTSEIISKISALRNRRSE